MKTVFLDRDGVINKDSSEYIKSWAEFEFLPGSLEAIRQLTLNQFEIIIITNQSAVNRKLITKGNLEYLHNRLHKAVASKGGQIRDIFFCPHTPEEACTCRKPKTGLIYRAQQKHQIDLASSAMVGDSAKDIECARNAGCRYAILVKTGNGIEAVNILNNKAIHPDFVAQDLLDAANWILRNRS
ncbi:MAG: D-glycero-beta-D-manno-heptose 1,7-bisphosphate 7-phosphatase [Desulfobacterales bacterium]|nr:MAG: D-glycero-beta-D-manno-heptose 1,7-bisphosphate 7-phosphatase [Desulfobacterales bacterium]